MVSRNSLVHEEQWPVLLVLSTFYVICSGTKFHNAHIPNLRRERHDSFDQFIRYKLATDSYVVDIQLDDRPRLGLPPT